MSAGTAADAGPNACGPPVVRDGVQPAPVSQTAPTAGGFDGLRVWVFLLLVIGGNALEHVGRLPAAYVYLIVGFAGLMLFYWETPRPRQSFLRWTLKVVGVCLNLFVALVTVPQLLRALLPDSLAFGLPAFFIVLVFYWVPPLTQNKRACPFWLWLLLGAGFAAFWGWAAPGSA